MWVFMELMETCLDRLLKALRTPIPEEVVCTMTVSVSGRGSGVSLRRTWSHDLTQIVKALNYLKTEHSVIHRGRISVKSGTRRYAGCTYVCVCVLCVWCVCGVCMCVWCVCCVCVVCGVCACVCGVYVVCVCVCGVYVVCVCVCGVCVCVCV